ncbi:MAG: hypothetical protein KF901_12225 [Myxococcales bacterium]|nr:hypothetical protein [Myxococcales bacterium]
MVLFVIACGDDATCLDDHCDAGTADGAIDAGGDDASVDPRDADVRDAPGDALDADGGPDAGHDGGPDAGRCDDGVLNGTESDVDCGGLCPPCASGRACREGADCASGGCVAGICRVGPTAAFTLDPATGAAPLLVTATSHATPGDAPITRVEYDFGDGFALANARVFSSSGTVLVRQRVVDEAGLHDTASRTYVVGAPGFDCRLSATDKTGDAIVSLTPDRLAAEWHTGVVGGVRSECAVAPASGVFYFEASIEPWECDPTEAPLGCVPTPRGGLNLGVGTASASLTTHPGSTASGLDVVILGGINTSDMRLGPAGTGTTWGFVVDYRGASPVVHVVGEDEHGPSVLASQALATNAPVHAMATGVRCKVGVDASFNFGLDTNNRPFAHDVDAVLRAEGLGSVADALVLGWTGTRALPTNARPSLTAPADMSVALGATVTLVASASDAEEGELSDRIVWEDLATVYAARDGALGGTFVYTPRTVGLHPIRVTVQDSYGARRQAIVRLEVTGALPTPATVRLVDDPAVDPLVGSGMALSPDGLSVRWSDPRKMALRANQGLYGDFWYFEATRLIGPDNQGAGLVIAEGDLDPYDDALVPPSCTLNTFGATWQNLMYRRAFDPSRDTYGFAVDYRGTSPVVYFVVGGEVVDVWAMYDAFVPVYPMLFGHVTELTAPYDIRANFGATPFAQNPCQALTAYGLPAADVAAMRVGWGAHATTACP